MRDIIIMGGPNGAGKTTAARVLLPDALGIREFVNADKIARGLSPFNEAAVAVTARRLMIERMRHLSKLARALPSKPHAPDLAMSNFCAAAATKAGA